VSVSTVPDLVLSRPGCRTLHVAFAARKVDYETPVCLACDGHVRNQSEFRVWDYRYRGDGDYRLCRTAACQRGFRCLDRAESPERQVQ
jgi:hypothetical protein